MVDVLPEALGAEGLVVKAAASRYVGGRREWLKVNSVGVCTARRRHRGRVVPGQVAVVARVAVRDRCRGRAVVA